MENDTNSSNYSYPSFLSTSPELLLPTWWKHLDEKYLCHSISWTSIIYIAYVFNLLLGVTGNVMVILVVLLRPKMRSVTNIVILNLAVADLLVIVFCMMGTFLSLFNLSHWKYSKYLCNGIAYVQGVPISASAYSLAAISLDRYKAICKSYGRSNGLSKDQCRLTIFLIWMTVLIITMPWALVFNVTADSDNGNLYCIESWPNELVGKLYFLSVKFIISFCLPVVLISASNLVIWCHVNHRNIPQGSDSSGSIRRMHRKARQRVFKLLGLGTLVYILSWLPFYLLVMRIKFGKNISESEHSLHGTLIPFAQWLCTLSCSINPILNAFLNKKFRKMLNSCLPSWIPFLRQSNVKYITRNTVASVSFRNRNSRRSSIGSGRSSRKIKKCGGKHLIERHPIMKYSTRAVYVTTFREKANKIMVQLNYCRRGTNVTNGSLRNRLFELDAYTV